MPSTATVRFSMQWTEDGKKRRVTGIDPKELGKLLGAANGETLDNAINQLATRTSANGRKAADMTPEQKAACRERNAIRRARLTPEQKAAEIEKRRAYNAKRNAEVREAMALLRQQQATGAVE